MTVLRLVAILAIFCCSTVAWFILGVSVAHRTGVYDHQLDVEVQRLWGGRHVQLAPQAWMQEIEERTDTVEEEGAHGEPVLKQVTRNIEHWHPLALVRSTIDVDLDLEHRRKGLLWYDLYGVGFAGRYAVVVPEEVTGPVRVSFQFPAPESIYDDFRFSVAGQNSTANDLQSAVVVLVEQVTAGQELLIDINYRSRGLDTWTYAFREQGVGQVRDFTLTMNTDFTEVDFPAGTVSPTERAPIGGSGGEQLVWRFANLVTGNRIGIDLPNRLNPGPLTQRVTFFAPVSLLFFLTVMVILGITKGSNLHLMHYFFLSAAFFAFHLLLAYLVDHVDLHVAFVIAAVVSMFLVVSYLRVVGGTPFAVREAGLAQLVYLVLFNYAFFFKGFTGLTITLGSVFTLFALMQLTAKVDWDRVFVARGKTAPPVAGEMAAP